MITFPRLRAAIATLVLCAFVGGVAPLDAKGGSVHVKGYTKKDGTYVAPHDRKAPSKKTADDDATATTATTTTTTTTAPRNEKGRIERSEAAKREFMKTSGFPNGRPGYVVDHIRPLACGGADAPSNMQWQTVEEAKAKDGWERRGC